MKNLYDYERTQSATTDLPFGALKNESSPGKQDGTDIVAEHIQDLAYSLYQVLQLAGINPNGELEDGNNKTQFIESLTNIGVFRYSDKTSYNYGVFSWQVIGNTFTLYRSLKNSNSDDVNNNESWLKILEIGADNKINFNVDTNILGLSANPSLSNLSEAGEDRLNVSKMYETGAVSNDTKGFKELLKRAHSTFDKSKFEVVGSPSITDNGIASGFSDTNYVQKSLDLSSIKTSIKINASFIFDNSRTEGTIWNKDLNFDFRVATSGNVVLRTFNGSGPQAFTLSNAQTGLKTGDNVDSSVIVTENQAIIIINGKTYTKSMTTDLSNIATSSVIMKFGKANIQELYYPNSIDLKSVAVWGDGVPVFNGNKTGLYVAKPDNYKKVGDVVVSDDGIASGFSTSNYITYNKQTLGDDFDIIFPKFKTSNVNQNANYLFSTSGHGLRVQLNSGKIRTIAFYGSDQYPVIQGLTQLQNNAEYLYKISRKKEDSNYTLTAFLSSDNGKTWVQQSQVTMTQDLYNSDSVGYLGGNLNSGDQIFNGSIDLNSFKIYVDGNLVYQPCLKIPYTEAFEHSKVVDVAYRNRVQDLYEQTGEALFYTIDEENQDFTLPAGDIYGMITKNREILDIVYPIGRPMPEENNVLLDNEVWLEGATVNIVDYPKLFKVYGTKYGGDGTTTFKLPDLRNRVLWGSSDGSNGYIEAKLPNIKGGSVLHSQDADGALNGCFYTTRSTISGNAQFPSNGRTYATYGAGINANLSNEIYSDDATTVQPPAFKVRWKTRFE